MKVTRIAAAAVLVSAAGACSGSCGSCSDASPASSDASSAEGDSGRAHAEVLPRCRPEPKELVLPGEDVVVGDAIVTPKNELVVGAVRLADGRRVASVITTSLDLGPASVVDVGPAFGEDPPPSPRVHGTSVFVAFYTRKDADAGVRESLEGGTGGMNHATRELRVAPLEGKSLGKPLGTVSQQADESTAYDVAWADADPSAAPLVAWDEDAPIAEGQYLADRGRVKVAVVGASGDAGAPVVVSPYATDADSPQLLARAGGYWLAWLARRPENPDAGEGEPEGPGEHRAFRWVEVVPLDRNGEVKGAIRRVSTERGRAVTFELQRIGAGAELVVLVQDEAAHIEGGGSRIVRYGLPEGRDTNDAKTSAADLVDGGVGRALAATFPMASDAGSPSRLLVWSDPNDHAHLLPLAPSLIAGAAPSLEPSLDGTRVVATSPDGAVFALALTGLAGSPAQGHAVLRRLGCKP